MNEHDLVAWLQAVISGGPVPGEYRPGTNPLDAMVPHE